VTAKRPRPKGPPYAAHEEYAEMRELLRKELTQGPGRHRKRINLNLLINQERLNALAEHHDTKVELGDRPPIVRRVTIEFRLDKRVARAKVTALGPIQGRAEAYTSETIPAQVGGSEKSSEGVSGLDQVASEKETIKP